MGIVEKIKYAKTRAEVRHLLTKIEQYPNVSKKTVDRAYAVAIRTMAKLPQ